MVYFISSVNFVPHFGNQKVYETFVWTPCFQILAKTKGYGERFLGLHLAWAGREDGFWLRLRVLGQEKNIVYFL